MSTYSREILKQVANYYSDKLVKYGNTPRGVDWNGEESQIIRFEQLCRILPDYGSFSLTDLGCGYGALLDYMQKKYTSYSYLGVDISSDMIRAAAQRHIDSSTARFIIADTPDTISDYGIASGIFNVRLGYADDEWYEYLQNMLEVLNRASRIGFAFNFLSSYSDKNKRRSDLYYADPCRIFELCKNRYSRHVCLFHDYDLYEFTIIIRKIL